MGRLRRRLGDSQPPSPPPPLELLFSKSWCSGTERRRWGMYICVCASGCRAASFRGSPPTFLPLKVMFGEDGIDRGMKNVCGVSFVWAIKQ